ncbi:MAG: hypothetical protein M1822_003674 [Bathelium mastoideum]|nr:MAG: hypothetical protein M1822_003674 [Bathelium mastoideum]
MSGPVQLQADVGSLGLQGLGAFSTILATLSADDVAPMAMIQLERLGAIFHTSGQFAKQVPDMLTRAKSHRISRLAVTIGWRKGDSASLLAETAGDQAIALLAVVLRNLFHYDGFGELLYSLSRQLLSPQLAVASMKQLWKAADLLASKLATLGFGNFLAKQVVRICDAYQSLGTNAPTDLLDFLSVEGSVELLRSLGHALQEEDQLVRITGTCTMGHIVGLVLFLFPQDALITIENIVLHEGERQNILLEVSKVSPGPAEIRLETRIKGSLFSSPIKLQK